LKILASKWNADRQRVTRSHPEDASINRRFSEIEGKAQGALSKLQTRDDILTATRIQNAVREAVHGTGSDDVEYEGFIPFAFDEVEGYRKRDQRTTARHYRTGVRKLLDFLEDETGKGRDNIVLPFSAMTVQLIKEFRNHMYEVRGNAVNTVGKTLTQIKTLWKSAVSEGHAERDPWDEITIDSEPSQKDKLSFDEIQRLEDLDLPDSTTQQRALDYFLFALYGGGMRFSDVATLKHKHLRGGRIHYKMKKTSEAGSVPIVDKAQGILDRYDDRPQEPESRVFPILDGYDTDDEEELQRAIESRNAYVNRQLKEVQQEADIETNLTFHLARHSAAWILYRELEDVYAVKRILGHSRVEVTEEYLRGFPDESIDDDYRDIF
jgi:site-specific recombinase XerD